MDDSMRRMIKHVARPEFWKGVAAIGPLVTEEELWGLPEYGSIRWLLMKASQVKFPDIP
jgi:hypothetical protein